MLFCAQEHKSTQQATARRAAFRQRTRTLYHCATPVRCWNSEGKNERTRRAAAAAAAAAADAVSLFARGRKNNPNRQQLQQNAYLFHFSKFICIYKIKQERKNTHTYKNNHEYFSTAFPPISDSTRQEQTSRRRHPSAQTSLARQGSFRSCSDTQGSSQAPAQQARGKGELGTAGSGFLVFFAPAFGPGGLESK